MKALLLVAALLVSTPFIASATTINFEQYSSGTQLTSQYSSSGVTFQNARTGQFGSNYPAHSGTVSITDYPQSPMTFTFSTPVEDFSFWYTAGRGATVLLFNDAGHQLDSIVLASNFQNTSLFSSALTGISSVQLIDKGGADYLSVDDLSFKAQSIAVTPEPGSLMLLGTGMLALTGVVRRRIARS